MRNNIYRRIILFSVFSFFLGFLSPISAIADADPTINILEPSPNSTSIRFEKNLVLRFQLIGGWATSLTSCYDIQKQKHFPIVAMAGIDSNGNGAAYEGRGGTFLDGAYYRLSFEGKVIPNGYECTGTFNWDYKPNNLYNWGFTSWNVNEKSWCGGSCAQSSASIFKTLFGATWNNRDVPMLGKISQIVVSSVFVDHETFEFLSTPQVSKFSAVTSAEAAASDKLAAEVAEAAAAKMLLMIGNQAGNGFLSLKPIIANKKQTSATITGALFYHSTNLPVVKSPLKICVSGENPQTGKLTSSVCTQSTTDSNGYFKNIVKLPPTFDVEVTIEPDLLDSGYSFWVGSDSTLQWSNKTYVSQFNAKTAADKKAAAAEQASLTARYKAEMQAQYNFGYKMISNWTTATFARYSLANFISPKGKLTSVNAKDWCSKLVEIVPGLGQTVGYPASTGFVNGCSAAALRIWG